MPAPQSEIPDDLKADKDLPLEVVASLANMRALLNTLLNVIDRLLASLDDE